MWSLPSCRTRPEYSLFWILSPAYTQSAGRNTGDSCDISVEFTGDSKKICREISLCFCKKESSHADLYFQDKSRRHFPGIDRHRQQEQGKRDEKMKAIYKRELRSYFTSMIGCAFAAVLTVIGGVYFMVYNLTSGYPYFSYSLSGVIFAVLITVPVLSMKCFAEERKNKTDQLLLTSPVPLTKIILGKIFCDDHGVRHTLPDLLPASDHQISGKCSSSGGLFFDPGFLSAGLCLYRHWNVSVFPDREPGHCGDQHLRGFILFVYA